MQRLLACAVGGLLVGATVACEDDASSERAGAAAASVSALPEPLAAVSASAVRSTATASAEPKRREQCCMGLNECRGKGGCAVPESHACKGQNACRGKGGCRAHCPR